MCGYMLTVWMAFTVCSESKPVIYRSVDKSLARPTSRCISFDGGNISFVASLVIYIYIYIYSTNMLPIMITIRI